MGNFVVPILTFVGGAAVASAIFFFTIRHINGTTFGETSLIPKKLASVIKSSSTWLDEASQVFTAAFDKDGIPKNVSIKGLKLDKDGNLQKDTIENSTNSDTVYLALKDKKFNTNDIDYIIERINETRGVIILKYVDKFTDIPFIGQKLKSLIGAYKGLDSLISNYVNKKE